jgi:hypothetical protein
MASRMAMSYGPQAAQVNEELPPKSSLNLTLMQHPRDEDLEPQECTFVLKLNPLELSIIAFFQIFAP